MTNRETRVSTVAILQSKVSLDYIDLLRGLAIIGVLLVHLTQIGMYIVSLRQLLLHMEWLLLAGKHGVSLFFVVSAYTLMRSMYARIDVEHMPMCKYFLRRFFRIAPAYYVVLLIVFFVNGKGFLYYVNPDDPTLTWQDLAAHFSFINGFFPYFTNDFLGVEWSVSTEFMFYVTLPFIFLWLHKTSIKSHAIWKISSLYFVSVALLWGMLVRGQSIQHLIGKYPSEIFVSWSNFFILSHLHEFALGVGVWVLLHSAQHNKIIFTNRQTNGWKLVSVLLISIVLAYVEGYWVSSLYVKIWALMIWGLLSAELICLLDALRPKAIWGMSFLGKISFSLYLVHMPIGYELSHFEKLWNVTLIPEVNLLIYEMAAWSLSVLSAVLLHQGVERPGMRLGRMVVGRLA